MAELATKRFSFTRQPSASNRIPRQINKNLVFHLIHKRQPLSRADLARLTGLQRRTISLIAEELIQDGWVLEGAIGYLPRGRRPTFLHVNKARAVIALDIHPSHVTVGVTDLGGTIVEQNLIDIPDDRNRAVGAIVRAVKKTLADHSERTFDGIGICLPGRFDPARNGFIFAPNLKWPVENIRLRIHEATRLRVEMDNVANACALSEIWFGDSDGHHDLVVVNVSEGLGTGIFANGHLLRGHDGMAGEFGHVKIDSEGPACGCGGKGCWETVASNRAGLRYYRELTHHACNSFGALMSLAKSGDKPAGQALEKMCRALGQGLHMVASALAPAEIVIVGDITEVWSAFGGLIETEMRRGPLATIPRVRPALEKSEARLRSAVALVMKDSSLSLVQRD